MNSQKTVIPEKIREEMSKDPLYASCSLFGQSNHECAGNITWEHAIIAKGSKVQLKWAIIPLCEKGHAVNNYQDAGTMNKEVNEWVALSIATDADLLAIYGEKSYSELGKAKIIFQRRRYLIEKYGMYVRKFSILKKVTREEILEKYAKLHMDLEDKRMADMLKNGFTVTVRVPVEEIKKWVGSEGI